MRELRASAVKLLQAVIQSAESRNSGAADSRTGTKHRFFSFSRTMSLTKGNHRKSGETDIGPVYPRPTRGFEVGSAPSPRRRKRNDNEMRGQGTACVRFRAEWNIARRIAVLQSAVSYQHDHAPVDGDQLQLKSHRTGLQ